MHSNAGVRSDLFRRPLDETLLTDFFGGVSKIELSEEIPASAAGGVAPIEEPGLVEPPRSRSRRRVEVEEEVTVEGNITTRTIGVLLAVAVLQIGALLVKSWI